MSSSSAGSSDQMKQAFQQKFQELVAQGYSSNQAAAEALRQLAGVQTNVPGNQSAAAQEQDVSMTDTAYKEETTHSVTTSESGTSVGAAAASSAESSSSSKRAKCTNEAKRKEESFSMLEQVDRMENIMNKDKLITTKELEDILENCSQTGQYTELTKKIGEGLRSPVNLNHSFLREEVLKATSNGGTAPTLYSASVEDAGIDTGNLRRLMEKIYSLDKEGPKNALVHAYEAAMNEQLIYADDPQRAVNELGDFPLNNAVHLRQFLIVAVDPQCMDPDSHRALKLVYKLADKLKSEARRVFAHWLSNLPAETLTYIVQCAQQFITLRLCQGSATIHEIRPPVNWLSLLHDANEVVHERCGRYPVPYEEFYNDVVSTEVNLEDDFRRWLDNRKKEEQGKRSEKVFSFCDHSFILDAGAKSAVLELDSRYQMAVEYRNSLMGLRLGRFDIPYFELKVRRDHLVEDALEQVTRANPKSILKRPLRVKFVGEAGLDEGGVRKEFFLLMVRQLFSPAFGMFKEDPETHVVWFNPDAFEAGASKIQFELIGSLIGLAIYNSVILDVNFPLVLYKKLKEESLTLRDIGELKPEVGRSLRQLLEYDGGDEEDVFCLNFTVNRETIWGTVETYELKENGTNVSVTAENKHEYVNQYIEWTLNSSVAPMFDAFKRGFHNVAGGPAMDIFRSDELQLLVIGSGDLDFDDLERTTRYESPFHKEHYVIKNFWKCVHNLSPEEKRQFLSFCTGSDRAPIRGLGSLELTVSRAGPDSDQLPTAHTCFNHVLIPEYPTYEKLESKLKASIKESQGFGLI